ncbi:hypothetical protein IP88_03125 [alpha proteobacterium AAP81b]|nr:hypothetical protein IP88_03125 [alpha proteobacterium AAP81b]
MTARVAGRRDDAGFTIIELLVALAIMGLLAGMLGAGLGLGRRIIEGGSVALADTDAVANTQMTLRERLMRLAPVPRDVAGGGIIEVRGLPGEFRWVGVAAGQLQPDSDQHYRLLLTAGGNLTLLTASTLDRRVDLGSATLAGWTPHVLLRDVSTLDIAYFGPPFQGRGGRGWQPSWLARTQPPELVRVRIGFAAGDRRHWPDFVVRPRTTISTACIISVQTGRCERG